MCPEVVVLGPASISVPFSRTVLISGEVAVLLIRGDDPDAYHSVAIKLLLARGVARHRECRAALIRLVRRRSTSPLPTHARR